MSATFREVFATFGIDESAKQPAMIVPLHGSGVVALEGGKDLKAVPKRDGVKAVKLEPSEVQRYLTQANQLGASARGGSSLSKDASFFAIHGNKPLGHDGTLVSAVSPQSPRKVEASIQVVVLAKKTVKIAIRPVKVRNEKGEWVFHSSIQFDLEKLRDQMNQIWTPQSNIDFKLVSTDPLLLENSELDQEIKRLNTSREAFLGNVHSQGFTPMFARHKAKDAELTYFVVKGILVQRLDRPREAGSYPSGATPDGEGISFICDKIAVDPVRQHRHVDSIPGIVLAHEAGHFMGFNGHDPTPGGVMLMVEGGPYVGFGKVSVAQTLQYFNTRYS